MSPSELDAADRGRGALLVALGTAACLGLLALGHFLAFPALMNRLEARQHVWALDAALALVFLLDVLARPTWTWAHGGAHLVRPWPRGREPEARDLDDLWSAMSPGTGPSIVKMLPLVASFTDPANRGLRKLIFLGDFLTIPLFGSRILRTGVERLRLASARNRKENLAAGGELTSWLKAQGPTPERKLRFRISMEPASMAGLALSRNLGRVARDTSAGEPVYRAA